MYVTPEPTTQTTTTTTSSSSQEKSPAVDSNESNDGVESLPVQSVSLSAITTTDVSSTNNFLPELESSTLDDIWNDSPPELTDFDIETYLNETFPLM